MVTQHEAYIRYSWTFRFICLALPLIIHLRVSSALDYVHGKESSVALEPDIASAIFVISVSLALNRILANVIPFYADEAQQQLAFKVETGLICLTMILANIVFCDLALRLIWIPIQYALWWICRKRILTLLLKALLFFVKDVAPFRPYYLKALAASSSKRAFHFLRLMTVIQILHLVLLRLERYSKPTEASIIERNLSTSPLDAPEGSSHESHVQQEKQPFETPSS
ncbi:uncharacterized protein LOC118513267 [Anopheles stephensi]|uniref:uncharacterized protein LOC118513267 n=1 Tax=Anopheles stephensi TaxID=30069 RepID=UPI0016589DAD|nr:uncharacterized protein LOC118513267 [Anopheles stephensi]